MTTFELEISRLQTTMLALATQKREQGLQVFVFPRRAGRAYIFAAVQKECELRGGFPHWTPQEWREFRNKLFLKQKAT